VFVDDGDDLDRSAVGGGIELEIDRPYPVGRIGGRCVDRGGRAVAFPAPPLWDTQSFIAPIRPPAGVSGLEVLLARIREFWLASRRTRADIDESVALGLARTGRVVTAAALIMSISFGGLVAAQVSFMRMFGLGLALAVLVDATLVLMILLCTVPFGRDQFEVARRVEIARCGTRLPACRLTPSRLRRKVLSAMTTTAAPSRLPTVSKRPGASRTGADVIEQYLRSQ
jgi:hypothetical protein